MATGKPRPAARFGGKSSTQSRIGTRTKKTKQTNGISQTRQKRTQKDTWRVARPRVSPVLSTSTLPASTLDVKGTTPATAANPSKSNYELSSTGGDVDLKKTMAFRSTKKETESFCRGLAAQLLPPSFLSTPDVSMAKRRRHRLMHASRRRAKTFLEISPRTRNVHQTRIHARRPSKQKKSAFYGAGHATNQVRLGACPP